jgi:hypothetical protein
MPLFVFEKVMAPYLQKGETPYWPRVYADLEKAAKDHLKEVEDAPLRRG